MSKHQAMSLDHATDRFYALHFGFTYFQFTLLLVLFKNSAQLKF